MQKLKKTRILFSVFAMLIAAVTISVIAVCISNANADILLSELGSNAAPAQEAPSVLPESYASSTQDVSSDINLYVPSSYLEDGINNPEDPVTKFLNQLNAPMSAGQPWVRLVSSEYYQIGFNGESLYDEYTIPYVEGVYSSLYAVYNAGYRSDTLYLAISPTPIVGADMNDFVNLNSIQARPPSVYIDAFPNGEKVSRDGVIWDKWKITKEGRDITGVWPRNINSGYNIFSDYFRGCIMQPVGMNGEMAYGQVMYGGSTPAANVIVQFTSTDGEITFNTVSNTNGYFVLCLPEFVDGSIIAYNESSKISNIEVTAEQMRRGDLIEIEIEKLQDTVTISGKVQGYREDDQGGELFPIPNAVLYFSQDTQADTMAYAGIDGSYIITVEKGWTGNLYATYEGFNMGSISFPEEITESKTGQNFELAQDTESYAVMYFSVNNQYAQITKNDEKETGAAGDLYKKGDSSYHYDWFSGDILVNENEGKNDVYRIHPKPGWAFYDWHILNWKNEPVDLKLNANVDENLFFYGHFKEAGQLTFASADTDKHQGFNIDISSNEENFPGVNMDESEYAASLYEGTEVTFENGYIKTRCEVSENDEDTYVEEYVITPVAQEGYEFDQWYRFGEPIAEGTTITMQQFDDFPITVSYKVATPQPVPDPVPGDDPGLLSEASYDINGSAATGDSNYLYVMGILMIAACSGLVFLRRAWKIK